VPNPFTLDDLRRILLSAAGVDDGVDIHGDILDSAFEDLGYESLALLETGGRIEREFDISLDDVLADATTPRKLVDVVNARLTETG
jgi:act minimal PKS acyl carrier protein